MYPVTDSPGLTMNGKELGSNQVKVNTESHIDLIKQNGPDDISKRRKCRRKVGGGSWRVVKKGVESGEKREDIKQEEAIGNYGCPICGKEFKRKFSLKHHVIHHNSKTIKEGYQCIGCKEGFKREKEKQEHELQCDRNERLPQLTCSFRELPCDTPKELRIHENKYRLLRKSKNCKNKCACIDCKMGFDAVSSLKVHIQRDHKSDVKPDDKSETLNQEAGTKQDGLDTRLNNVSNQFPDKPNEMQDKPFSCWKCGSRYKYEKSKIKHELKYHLTSNVIPTKTSQHSGEEKPSEQNRTSQVTDQDGSPCSIGAKFRMQNNEGEESADEAENLVNNDNNNIIPVDSIKKENDFSFSVVDVSVCGLSDTGHSTDNQDKESSPRSHLNRQPIIKKKCIGCDKVFDGHKEKEEHELRCGLNCFNRRFNCMFCDHPFVKPKALRKHENKHRPVRKTKKYKNRCVCIECNKTFDAIYSLRVHMKKLHRKGHAIPFENKPFACSVCDARFKYENSKYKHEARYHSADLNQTTKNSTLENICTNLNPNVLPGSDGGCKMEPNDPEEAVNQGMKEESVGDMCGADNFGYLTENKVVNPLCDIKTEIDVDFDTQFNIPLGDDVDVQTNEINKLSQPSRGGDARKRKGKKSSEKKTKRQKTGPYVCNNCEAKFNSPQGLWLHSYHQNMRTKRLSCIGCGRSFKGEKETEEHELRCNLNHNEYDFNCMFCDEPFGTPKLLRNHELEHRPRRRTKNHKCVCIDCRKPFDSIHSLKEHIRENHKIDHIKLRAGGEERAPLIKRRDLTMEEMMSCYVLLNDIGEMKTEKATAKPPTSISGRIAKGARCMLETDTDTCLEGGYNVCGSTTCNVDLNAKDEANYNNAVCDMSGIGEQNKVDVIKQELPYDLIETPAFLVEAQLANPEGMTHETRSFQCGKCNEKFDSYAKLRYHSYSHRQRTKRLFCIGCGLAFEQGNDRDRHELECSVNLTNGRFNCIFCELPFDTPQLLRNHEKKHRPPKRYKRYKHMCLCAECDRAFDAVFTLKVHIRHMHRGGKEKVKIKEEIEDVHFESDLTFEEYKFDGDLKVERFH